MNVAFVTGSAGQLGSALVERLLAEKYQVIALIKPHHDARFLESLGVKTIIRAQLYEPETYRDAIPEKCTVFHCYSLSPGANARKEVYDKENVLASHTLLSVAREKKVTQFIYTSSVSVVGPKAIPMRYITETDETTPDDVYGKSKLAVEEEIRAFHAQTGISCLLLRIFPLYGPHAHKNSTPVRMAKLLQQKRFFMVGDGSNDYEFCYSKNAAEGIVLAAKKIKTGLEVVNISEPKKRTYSEVIREFATRVNPNVHIIHVPVWLAYCIGFVGEIGYVLFRKRSITRLRTVYGLLGKWNGDCGKEVHMLGYTQRYSLEEGLDEFVAWARETGAIKIPLEDEAKSLLDSPTQ